MKERYLAEQKHQNELSLRLHALLNSDLFRSEAFQNRNIWEKIAGNTSAGRVLFEILYWHLPTKEGEFKLKVWDEQNKTYYFWHKAKQFVEKCCRSKVTVDRACYRLRKLGLINYTVRKNFVGETVRHFTLNHENLYTALINNCREFGDNFVRMIIRERSLCSFPIYIKKKIKKENNIDPDQKISPNKIDPITQTRSTKGKLFFETEKISTSTTKKTKINPNKNSYYSYCSSSGNDHAQVEEKINAERKKEVALDEPTQSKATFCNESVEVATKNIFTFANSCSSSGDDHAQVEEKINEGVSRQKKPIALFVLKAIAKNYVYWIDEVLEQLDFKRIKLKMARHRPEGDRFFGRRRNQQAEIRERTKMNSTLGMSQFKSVEDLQKCEEELTDYYLKTMSPVDAEDKAFFKIQNACNGRPCGLVKDYYAGKPIGARYKQEWEVEPGVIAPTFLTYLRDQLRRDGDTHARTVDRVGYTINKKPALVHMHWKEFKRKLTVSIQGAAKKSKAGINPANYDIPKWMIEANEPEIGLEEAADMASKINLFAKKIIDQRELNQRMLNDGDYARLHQASQPQTETIAPANNPDKRSTPSLAKQYLQEILPKIPRPDPRDTIVSPEQEIDLLLKDPITRGKGIQLASSRNLPLLLSTEGEAIAVNWQEFKSREGENDQAKTQSDTDNRSYAPHQAFVPEKIEKAADKSLLRKMMEERQRQKKQSAEQNKGNNDCNSAKGRTRNTNENQP